MTRDPEQGAGGGVERPDDSELLQPIDLLLGEGTPAELQRCRDHMSSDPLAALEYAETRQLVEELRELTVEPTPRLQGLMDTVVRQSERRLRLRQPTGRSWGFEVGLVAAAAAVLLSILLLTDPMGLQESTEARSDVAAAQNVVSEPVRSPAAPEAPAVSVVAATWDAAVRLGPGSKLASAWSRFQSAQEAYDGNPAERLSRWLSSRNALAVMQLDYELRSTPQARHEALRKRGHPVAIDRRVQQLAATLSEQLLEENDLPAREVAMCVRALLAAGDDYQSAMRRGGDRLVASLPAASGGELASSLLALGELAAATGQHAEVVREHSERLLDEVLSVDEQTWTRRRPRLLSGLVSAAEIGDAGRLLALMPAFGVDPEQALFVRLLMAAHLQERRDVRNDTPEILAALAYGFGDLLRPEEGEEVDSRLRTWSPVSVVPDYLALHQLAGSRSPATLGYARFQLALRRIMALEAPEGLSDRAALCLCLAANFRPQQLGSSGLALGQ